MADYIKMLDNLDWNKVDELRIDKFCWDYDFKPLSKAKICMVKNKGIYVKMWSYEDNPKSVHSKNDEMVCEDSCLEFFFNAVPEKSDIYINFEVNHLGTMLAMYGSFRGDRKFLSELNVEYPQVTAFSGSDSLGAFWGIEYLISFDLINTVYNETEYTDKHIIKAGLYKCGDETGRTHYGSWQVIHTEQPDFHRPEFFGDLTIIKDY